MKFAFLAALLCVAVVEPLRAQTPPKRAALVIGNARYEPKVGPLRNPVRDADAVAKVLRSLGFQVDFRRNLSRAGILEAVDLFRKSSANAEVALFYYAGHGISVGGSNYLIPIQSGFDLEGADATSLKMRAETRLYNVEQALADLIQAGAKCSILVLDACRTSLQLKDPHVRSWGNSGFVEMTPPAGSIIAFSTDAGKTALDGLGENGIFTEAWLEQLALPGLTIEQVFKRTREKVLARTNGQQMPAEYSRLIGEDIYLAGRALPAIPAEGLQGPTLQEVEATLLRAKERLDTTKQADAEEAQTLCRWVLEALPKLKNIEAAKRSELEGKAQNRLGSALLLQKDYAGSLQALDRAVELLPQDPYPRINRGEAWLRSGNAENARKDYQEAVTLAKEMPKALKLAKAGLKRVP